MDQQDTTTTDADAAWPELAADITLARGAARSITLDTQRASTDGRILDIAAQLEQMGSRLAAVEDNLFETTASTQISDELMSRLAILGEELAATSAEFDALASRVAAAEEGVATTMMVSVDGFDSRLAIVEDARLSQTGELNELTGYLEQAFTRIAELAEVIEVERSTNASLRTDIAHQTNTAAGTADTRFGDLDIRVSDVQTSLDALRAQVSDAAFAIDSSNDDLTEALASTVAQLEGRVAATESRMGEFDDIAASIQFLTSRAEALSAIEENQVDPTVVNHLRSTIDNLSSHVDQLSNNTENADLSARLDELRSVVDEVTKLRSVFDETRSATSIELDAHRVAIDRVNDEAHASRQLTQDVSDRITNMGETFELIGQRIDLVDSGAAGLRGDTDHALQQSEAAIDRVEHLDQAVEAISSKLENAATALDAAHTRVDDAEATAQSAHARLDAATGELQQRFDESVQSVNERLHEANHDIDQRLESTVQHIDGQLSETSGRIGQRVEDVERKLDHEIGEAHRRIEPLEGRISPLEARILESDDRAETISANFESQIHESDERANAIAAKLDQTIDCIEGVVGATTELAGRVTTTETQASTTSAQISAATDRLDDAGRRLDENEEHAASIDERVSDLSNHVAANSEHLGATEHNVAEQAQHIISNEQRIADHEGRIATSEQQFASTNEQLLEIDGRLVQTETAISERLDETAGLAEGALRATEDLDSRIDSNVEARATQLREHLLERVEEARAQLQLALDETQANVGESQADLRRSIMDRLEVIEQAVDTRVGNVEAMVHDADISVRMTSVEAALGAAHTTADEAYAFTESLRQLQTDIVQALQEELRSHEQLIGSTQQRVVELEHSGSEFASAERVHMLEAKLVEALQTISQLTQLQRRNTTVESQLTDTLAATSHGVENTQTVVAGLRDELDSAQQRISHLERVLSATAAAAPTQAVATSPPVSAVQPVNDNVPPQVAPQPADTVEDDADTGWFTESYARKNPETKAS